MAIDDVIDFKLSDFVPYFGKKNYICRTADLFHSEYKKVIEDKVDTLGLLKGAYMMVGVASVFVLLKMYLPLE